MASPTMRHAATFAAGLAAGLLLGWLLRGGGETRESTSPSPETSPARTTSLSATRAPRRRTPETAEPETAAIGEPAQQTASNEDTTPAAPAGAGGTTTDAPSVATRDGAVRPASGDAAPGSAAVTPATPPAREAKGVVVDAATQQPIAGARVLFAIATGGRAGSWWGDTTSADGRFANRVDDDTDLAGQRMELRISKDGYEPVRVAAEGGDLRVELRPRTSPVLPGRVAGLARGPDGKPLAGEIEVNGYDGEGANATQWTIADAAGAFVLEGVPPGSWQLRIGSGPRAEVTVAEGGEARVELTSAKSGDGFVVTDVDPSKVVVEGAKANEALADLRRLFEQASTLQSIDAATRERLLRQFALEIQQLESRSLAAAPRRELAITGLTTETRAWLRLEQRPRHFRRVEVQSGVARLPSVPLGKYLAVLVEPGRPDRTMQVAVAAGEGPLDVEFR